MGCSSAFAPDSLVNSMRVLAIRADSPELHPGDSTNLEPLLVDPTRPGQLNTMVWFGCDPDPLDLDRSACSNLGNVQTASALLADIDGGQFDLPPGMHTIGYDGAASYTAPSDSFAQIPAGDPRLLIGTIADMLIVAAAGDLPLTATDAQKNAFFTAVENATIPSVLVIDRLVISEETPLNQNPVLGPVTVDGTPLPDGGTFRVAPGDSPSMDMIVPDSSFETYQEIQPDGTSTTVTESLIAAYYATTGNFSLDRVALRSGTPENFTAPDGSSANPVPPDRAGTLWVVVRDTRGGLNWVQYPLFICDPTLPAPAAASLDPPSGPANGNTTLGVKGQNLSSVLDVVLGGMALGGGAYSPILGEFVGVVPPLPSGTYPVSLRGKDCQDYPTSLSYVVP
jgi:hypothetical protein